MKHKIILSTIFAGISSFSANAEELTIISGAPLAAVTTIYAHTLSSVTPNATLKVEKDCTSAIASAKTIENSIYLTSNNQIVSAALKNKNCRGDISKNNIITIVNQHHKVCKLPSNSKTLTTPGVTFGWASVGLPTVIAADFNKNNPGANIIGIPFKGSVEVLTAVLNKDVDYGVIGTGVASDYENKKELVCEYDTTKKGSETGKSLNDHFKLGINGFPLTYILVGPSIDIHTKTEIQTVSLTNTKFKQFLKNGVFSSMITKITDNEMQKLNDQLDHEIEYFRQK